MARITVKNDNVTFEVPDGARLHGYLWKHSSFPQGCENGTSAVCACVITRGVENLNPKTQNETETFAKANLPNSNRNRLACQVIVKKGEVEIEY